MEIAHIIALITCTPWLLILGICDAKYRRLPNRLTLGGAIICFVILLGAGGLTSALSGLLAGVLCGLFLFIPFLLRAAGGGDVKMLFACGMVVGLKDVMNLLLFMSIAGFILAMVMWFWGRVDARRLKHYFRCVFDWRYDRKAGRAQLPPRESESGRVPFGVAIAAGTWATLLWDFAVK